MDSIAAEFQNMIVFFDSDSNTFTLEIEELIELNDENIEVTLSAVIPENFYLGKYNLTSLYVYNFDNGSFYNYAQYGENLELAQQYNDFLLGLSIEINKLSTGELGPIDEEHLDDRRNAPKIIDAYLDKTVYYAGDTATVTFIVETDNIAYLYTGYQSYTGLSKVGSIKTQLENNQVKIEDTYQIDDFVRDNIYTFSEMFISDADGYYHSYNSEEDREMDQMLGLDYSFLFNNLDIIVKGNTTDSTAPQIINFSHDKEIYGAGDTMTITLEIEEETDINYVELFYVNATDNNSLKYFYVYEIASKKRLENGNIQLRLNYTLPDKIVSDDYYLKNISVSDSLWQSTNLEDSEISQYGNAWMSVEGNGTDVTAPQIIDIDVERENYELNDKVNITVKVADESDLIDVNLQMYQPDGWFSIAFYESDEIIVNEDGTKDIVFSYVLGKEMYHRPYTSYVRKIELVDEFGNIAEYDSYGNNNTGFNNFEDVYYNFISEVEDDNQEPIIKGIKFNQDTYYSGETGYATFTIYEETGLDPYHLHAPLRGGAGPGIITLFLKEITEVNYLGENLYEMIYKFDVPEIYFETSSYKFFIRIADIYGNRLSDEDIHSDLPEVTFLPKSPEDESGDNGSDESESDESDSESSSDLDNDEESEESSDGDETPGSGEDESSDFDDGSNESNESKDDETDESSDPNDKEESGNQNTGGDDETPDMDDESDQTEEESNDSNQPGNTKPDETNPDKEDLDNQEQNNSNHSGGNSQQEETASQIGNVGSNKQPESNSETGAGIGEKAASNKPETASRSELPSTGESINNILIIAALILLAAGAGIIYTTNKRSQN